MHQSDARERGAIIKRLTGCAQWERKERGQSDRNAVIPSNPGAGEFGARQSHQAAPALREKEAHQAVRYLAPAEIAPANHRGAATPINRRAADKQTPIMCSRVSFARQRSDFTRARRKCNFLIGRLKSRAISGARVSIEKLRGNSRFEMRSPRPAGPWLNQRARLSRRAS